MAPIDKMMFRLRRTTKDHDDAIRRSFTMGFQQIVMMMDATINQLEYPTHINTRVMANVLTQYTNTHIQTFRDIHICLELPLSCKKDPLATIMWTTTQCVINTKCYEAMVYPGIQVRANNLTAIIQGYECPAANAIMIVGCDIQHRQHQMIAIPGKLPGKWTKKENQHGILWKIKCRMRKKI